MAAYPADRSPGAIRRFFSGVGYLGRGMRAWGTNPLLMLLGAIPALIVGLVYLAVIVALLINLSSVASWLTPFADSWDLVTPFRVLVGTALVGGVVVLAAVTYAAVTLAVGDPFYERIWHAVEAREGGAPASNNESFWAGARRGIANGLRLFVLTASVGVLVFAGGFIPVIGQSLVPVLAAFIGGWFLAIELTGYAFDARALRLGDRRLLLGANRATTLGFGVATYVLFLVPLVAVVAMPAAVAGATLLARDALRVNDS